MAYKKTGVPLITWLRVAAPMITVAVIMLLDAFFDFTRWAVRPLSDALGSWLFLAWAVVMAAFFVLAGVQILRKELPKAIDAIEADSIRMKGRMCIILAGVLVAFAAWSKFS